MCILYFIFFLSHEQFSLFFFFITQFLSLHCCSNKYPHYVVVDNPANNTTPSLNYITSHVRELLRVRGRHTRVLCHRSPQRKKKLEKRCPFSLLWVFLSMKRPVCEKTQACKNDPT